MVLAAGASTRMGEPKALLRTPDGRRYVDAIAETARAGGCDEIVVVAGPPHGQAIRAALPPAATAAWNAEPARGMLSSVQAGIAALPAGVAAVLIWPVDIPFVEVGTARSLVEHDGTIVVPVHNGRGGHPLRVARVHFAEIMTLDPARGLRALVDGHAAEVVRLPVADAGVLVDVDTPDDYARTRA
ncbi:MAG TPA: nucleotidyltransferase family protein [Polyangia bacterium]